MIKRILKICFVSLVLLLFLCSFAGALLSPTEISWAEHRYAEQLPPFTVEGFLDGSFQDSVENALGDQISFAGYFKAGYNSLTSAVDRLFSRIYANIPDRYISYKDMYLFNGQLVLPTVELEEIRGDIDSTARCINDEIASLPETEFFLYYVTCDSDFDFQSGRREKIFEYLRDCVDVPEENVAALELSDFAQYRELFYYSDHHWNHIGSYRAYLQLLELLRLDSPALVPTEELTVPGIFNGSRSLTTGRTQFYDVMQAYRFAFPPMETQVSGMPATEYGNLETLLQPGYSPSYAGVYGEDFGHMIISTEKAGGDKLLLVGDSYDNAVIKLLAAHCSQLHSVDVRYYTMQTGESFDLCDYVTEHGIEKVLFIGNNIFFEDYHRAGD